jgi:hypothetical protein
MIEWDVSYGLKQVNFLVILNELLGLMVTNSPWL